MEGMNKLACFLGLIFVSMTAHAAILNSPFMPEADKRFDIIENPASVSSIGSQLGEKGHSGVFVQHEAKGIVSLIHGTGSYNTPIVLPKNAVIQQAYIFVESAQAPGTNTMAFQCDSANDILSAADESAVSAGGIISGVETGTAATMHYSSAGCTVKLVVAGGALTAGKVDLILDYVVVK